MAANTATTTATESDALGNGERGVAIQQNATSNTIGGTASGASNTIAFNDTDGVAVSQTTSTGNRILSNRIFQNGAVGLDLQGTNDVTSNDDDDPDTGANNLQNFPVITSATRNASGTTTISGTLNSNPSQSYTIQCFIADGDSTNHGEVQTLLDTTTTTTGDGGKSPTFTCTSNNPDVLATVSKVTTTATNTTSGDTSEFSENEDVVANA